MKRILLILCIFLFSGCDLARGIPLPVSLSEAGAASATTTRMPGTGTPTGGSSKSGEAKSTVTSAVTPEPGLTATPFHELTLWVPPEFDPGSDTPAGNLLRRQLAAFSQQNGGVQVKVRVKAASGASGLLESLNASSAVATQALPAVIALPRADLEVAALKGLIYPLDGVSKAIEQPDWYDYARQLARVQGATFALPFAGDAMVVAYRPERVTGKPSDWPSIYRLGQPLAFPAGDTQALFTLALYESVGGAVEDAQHRPSLQPDLLSKVLQVMSDGETHGTFPYWLSQYETSGQVWQAYRDQRVSALVTWLSNYLSTLPPDTNALPLPAMNGSPLTLATGWGWAVADPVPERRALSVRLAEFLSHGDFLAAWTEAAGYLPTRPSSLTAWKSQSLKTLLGTIALSAQARPTGEQLSSLGPVLKDATLKVLKHDSDPTQAAKAASERLAVPETK